MAIENFVGRNKHVMNLEAVLTRDKRADGTLTILSVEGSGGIGKTYFLNHVIGNVNLNSHNYLTLRIDGSKASTKTLAQAVALMTDSAKAIAIRDRAPGYYFPSVHRVLKEIEAIPRKAIAELKENKSQSDQKDGDMLVAFIEKAFSLGQSINSVLPRTLKYFNFKETEKENLTKLITEMRPLIASMQKETPWIWERLGIGESTSLRNAIIDNACQPLANALVSDLNAVLCGYQKKEIFKAAHSKVKGIDRLLLIFDDYEMLRESLEVFLLENLFPLLCNADFETVVIILGRDALEITHPNWNQHLGTNKVDKIALDPLSQEEMNELVEKFGIQKQDEKERAWHDTQGHPLYVHLWTEEAASGGRSAVMLKQFHDRTTRWMDQRQKLWLQHILFLQDVDKPNLKGMLDCDDQTANEVFAWFEQEGSIRDTKAKTYRVREYLRSRLIDYLRICDSDYCEQLRLKGETVIASKGQ